MRVIVCVCVCMCVFCVQEGVSVCVLWIMCVLVKHVHVHVHVLFQVKCQKVITCWLLQALSEHGNGARVRAALAACPRQPLFVCQDSNRRPQLSRMPPITPVKLAE